MTHLYVQTMRAALTGIAAFLAIIFLPAGTLDYWQGWVYFATFSIASALLTAYMAIYDQELLQRRLHAGPAAEKTPAQKIIMSFAMIGFVASIVVPVLDHRFGWSPAMPASVSIVADAFIALSFAIIFLVVKENSYAASTIQVDEGQQVVSTGRRPPDCE